MKARLNKVSLVQEILRERERGIITGACSNTAAVCYVLYQRGWHKDAIIKLVDDIIALYDMPPVFGRQMDNSDVIGWLGDKGIDVMRVADHIEIELEVK